MAKQKISLRKEQMVMTRQAISKAAISLLTKKGYYNVTVDQICVKARVSKGTFYSHFKSKNEIVLEEFLKLDQYYGETVLPDMADKKHALDKLLVFCTDAMTYVGNIGMSNTKVAYQSQLGPERGYSRVASDERTIFTLVKQAIEEGQKAGELRQDINVNEFTRTFITAIRGVVFEWCLTNGKIDLMAETKRMFSIITEGMRCK